MRRVTTTPTWWTAGDVARTATHGTPLHDPTAAVVAVDRVELAPGRTRGMLLVDRRPCPVPDPAAAAVVLAADRVAGQLLDVLAP